MENNKAPLKPHKFNPGILILLAGAGSFLFILLLSKLLDFPYSPYSISFNTGTGDLILVLVFLLVLCLVSGGIILWAYSRIQPPEHPGRVFVYGFLFTVVIAFLSGWFISLPGQYLWRRYNEQSPHPGVLSMISYLPIGLGAVLFACAAPTLTLLWIARRKNTGETPAALFSRATRRQDILLVAATLITYGLVLKAMIEFIFSAVLLFRIR